MNDLSYFIGKVCTILTSPVNRQFVNETQYVNIFVGIVDSINEKGIWIIKLGTRKKAFFTFHALVGINEESISFFENEQDVKDFEKQLKAKIPPKDAQQLISIESINKLKKNQGKKDETPSFGTGKSN